MYLLALVPSVLLVSSGGKWNQIGLSHLGTCVLSAFQESLTKLIYVQVGDMNKGITRSGLEGVFWSHITQLFIEESSFATASEEGFSSILPPDSGK